MKRRNFNLTLASSVIYAVAPKNSALAFASLDGMNHSRIDIIVDERISEARQLVAQVNDHKTAIHRYAGNFSPTWFDLVQKICADKRNKMIGMTRYSDAMIFSAMLEGHGYQVSPQRDFHDYVLWVATRPQ